MDPIPLPPTPRPPIIAASATVNLRVPRASATYKTFIGASAHSSAARSSQLRVNGSSASRPAPSPLVSRVENEIVKRILGTTPVHEDGSAAFEVPAGRPLQFQLLDAHDMAVMTMRSQVYVQPGETVSCIGLHEPRQTLQGSRPGRRRLHSPVVDAPSGTQVRGRAEFRPHGSAGARPVLHPLSRTGADEEDRPRRNDLRRYARENGSTAEVRRLLRRLAECSRVGANLPSATRRAIPAGRRTISPMPAGWRDVVGRASRRQRKKLVDLDGESRQRIVDWLDLNAQYYGDYSFNRAEGQPPCPEGEAALRAAIARRFGPELARQPYAALVMSPCRGKAASSWPPWPCGQAAGAR